MKIKDKLPIGEKIKYWRKKRNMTQAALAEKLLITPSNISQIENGSRSPTIATIEQIADALGIDVAELVSDPESMQLAVEIKKQPTEGERPHVTDDDIKFALFGTTDIDDETFEDVKALARVAAEQAAKRKRKKQE